MLKYLIILLLPGGAMAQSYQNVTNTHLPDSATNFNTLKVKAADLDGDGDKDLILAMELARNKVLFNNNGVFEEDATKLLPVTATYPNQPYWTGEGSTSIFVDDIDGDNDIDILFGTSFSDHHELLLNDGTGLFVHAAFQFPKVHDTRALLPFDANNDGKIDIMFGNDGQNDLFLSNGDGTYTLDNGLWLVNTARTNNLTMGDINGDGEMDIIEVVEAGANNIYLSQNGQFVLSPGRIPSLGNVETMSAALEDIDGDNDLDLFLSMASWNSGKIPYDKLLENDGTGHFTDVSTMRMAQYSTTTVDAQFEDINNDGIKDLITVGFFGQPNIKTHFNNAQLPGYFTENSAYLPSIGNRNVASMLIEDLNGDGVKDYYFGCYQSKDALLLSTGINSISNSSFEASHFIYPNPIKTNQFLQIKSSARLEKIEILNMDGTGQELNFDFSDNLYQVSLNDYKSGVYLLKLVASDGVKFERIVVN